MKLIIKNNWRIESNRYSFMTIETKLSEDGDLYDVIHSYHTTFVNALKYFYNNIEMKTIESENFEGFIKEFMKIKRSFDQNIKRFEV